MAAAFFFTCAILFVFKVERFAESYGFGCDDVFQRTIHECRGIRRELGGRPTFS